MIPAGFEPATVRLEGECSIQLSYGDKVLDYCIKTKVKVQHQTSNSYK